MKPGAKKLRNIVDNASPADIRRDSDYDCENPVDRLYNAMHPVVRQAYHALEGGSSGYERLTADHFAFYLKISTSLPSSNNLVDIAEAILRKETVEKIYSMIDIDLGICSAKPKEKKQDN